MVFVVSSTRETGTIRYFCGTTGSALDKVHDFRRAEYRDITIVTAEDRAVTEEELRFLAQGEPVRADGSLRDRGSETFAPSLPGHRGR